MDKLISQLLTAISQELTATITEAVKEAVRAEIRQLFQDYSITPDEKFLTVKQVAEMFSVSERTVRNWIVEEKLPSRKMGGVVRIKASDLIALEEGDGNNDGDGVRSTVVEILNKAKAN